MGTNPAVARGSSISGGGAAAAEVLSEHGDTLRTRARKANPDIFVFLVPDRDIAGLHAGDEPLQLAVVSDVASRSSRKP